MEKRVCIIGCGNIFNKHVEALMKIDYIKIVALCDIDYQCVKLKAKKYNCKYYTNFVKMLEAEHPDVVHICTPHYTHEEISITCMSKGADVIIEKPIAINVASAKKIVEAQERYRRKATVVYQNRLNESVLYLKDIIKNKIYGDVTGFQSVVTWKRDPQYYEKSWRKNIDEAGGGVIINQAIHSIDLINFLLGKINAVNCIKGKLLYNSNEVEDTAIVSMTLNNNIKGILFATVCNAKNVPARLDVYFSDTSISITGNNVQIYCNEKLIDNIIFDIGENNNICYGNSHEKFIKQFYSTEKNDDGLPTLLEGMETIKIVRKIYE